jgi:hypothetical protein
MSSAGFEPTTPASHRPHTLTLALDRSATGIGFRLPDRPVRSQSLYRLSYPAHSGRKTWDNCIISVFLSHWRDRRVGKASRVGENLFQSERASAHNTQIFEPRWYPLAKYLFVVWLKNILNLPGTHKNLRNYVNTGSMQKQCKSGTRVHSASCPSLKGTTNDIFTVMPFVLQ